MGQKQAVLWNYTSSSAGFLPILSHCGCLYFHGSSWLSWIAFTLLREKLDLLCPPAVVQIQVCITSVKVCSSVLQGDAKMFCWMLMDSGNLVSLSTKSYISFTSLWTIDHWYWSFWLSRFSAVFTNTYRQPKHSNRWESFHVSSKQTKCSQVAFSLIISLAVLITKQCNQSTQQSIS